MEFKESKAPLAAATLQLQAGPTRLPEGAATVAANVQFAPVGTISKRQGYTRFLDVAEPHPVTGVFYFDDHWLILAGVVDELDTGG